MGLRLIHFDSGVKRLLEKPAKNSNQCIIFKIIISSSACQGKPHQGYVRAGEVISIYFQRICLLATSTNCPAHDICQLIIFTSSLKYQKYQFIFLISLPLSAMRKKDTGSALIYVPARLPTAVVNQYTAQRGRCASHGHDSSPGWDLYVPMTEPRSVPLQHCHY